MGPVGTGWVYLQFDTSSAYSQNVHLCGDQLFQHGSFLGAYSQNKKKWIEITPGVLGHFKDLDRKLFFKDLLFQNFLKLEQT